LGGFGTGFDDGSFAHGLPYKSSTISAVRSKDI
jgi:hypothetical protein